MEDPGPPRLPADPRAGLVGLQDGAGQQPVADQARLAREGLAAGFQQVGPAQLSVRCEARSTSSRRPREPPGLIAARLSIVSIISTTDITTMVLIAPARQNAGSSKKRMAVASVPRFAGSLDQ
jgi:hypothetical protein